MRDVSNPEHHAALDERKVELENELRRRYARLSKKEFGRLPSIQPYAAYYGRFGKTYHVQLQLESVVLKNKSIPGVAALVEGMFMAELKNQLLTAGHDWQAIEPPLRVDVAKGEECYILLGGQEQTLKPQDMFVADRQGIISSILYGPDQRTRIVPQTRHVLFVVYAPPGVSEQALLQHLEDIRTNANLVAPEATVESQRVYRAAL